MNWQRDIEVLTPLFNRGAYQDTPEIRVPSIRGMVRWWFRQLEYQFLSTDEQQRRQQLAAIRETEKQLFGGVHGGAVASRLIFRVKILSATVAQPPGIYTLPHKPPARDPQNLNTERDPRAPRAAFKQGASFRLEVFSRFGDLPSELETKAKNALEVWLLLGSLGLRANRGGGSVWPADGSAPKDSDELREMLRKAGLTEWSVALVGLDKKKSTEDLRATATDTIKGNTRRDIFGSVSPRLSSPTKFKVIRLDDGYCLLACAPSLQALRDAERLLTTKPNANLWQALGNWNYILP